MVAVFPNVGNPEEEEVEKHGKIRKFGSLGFLSFW